MSKIQVLIDLGTMELAEDSDISPHGILKALSEIDSVKESNSKLAKENSMLRDQIAGFVNTMQSILEADDNIMTKLNNLRQLSREIRSIVR